MRLIRIMLALALGGTVIALAAPTAGSAAAVTAPRVVLYQGGGDPTQFGPAVQPPGANTVSTDPGTITTTNDGTLEEDTSLTASGVTDGGEWWYDPSPSYVELHAFYWEEPDGTRVLAQNLTDAVGWYDLGNGLYTPECLAWEPYNTLDVQYIRLNLNNYTWSKSTSSCTAALSDTAVATRLSGGGQSGTSIPVPAGTAVTDTATLSGTNASTATGTVTYDVYSDSACTVAVNAGKPETTTTPGTLPASDPVTLSTAGTYYWRASYSGDAGNGPSTSACGTAGEVETVAPVSCGSAATGYQAVNHGGSALNALWAGYHAMSTTPCTFTSVTGQWVQPALTCPGSNEGTLDTSFWVGLDGAPNSGSGTVEQTGIEAQCIWGLFGYHTVYRAWYQMFPALPVYIGDNGAFNNVGPGSLVKATVTYDGNGEYSLNLTVTTKDSTQSASTEQPCTNVCENISAEWIVEKQEDLGMADFGAWNLTDGYATTTAGEQTVASFDPIRSIAGTIHLLAVPSLVYGPSFVVRAFKLLY
jgi:hypothetical protein